MGSLQGHFYNSCVEWNIEYHPCPYISGINKLVVKKKKIQKWFWFDNISGKRYARNLLLKGNLQGCEMFRNTSLSAVSLQSHKIFHILTLPSLHFYSFLGIVGVRTHSYILATSLYHHSSFFRQIFGLVSLQM